MPLLVDTGVLYALADRSDAWHARCVALVKTTAERLLAPAPVLPEAAYLLASRLGASVERRFVRSLADEEVAVENLRVVDYARVHAVMQAYPDIGFVDASLVAVAERLKLETIATTDRRRFTAIRPAHFERFTLLP